MSKRKARQNMIEYGEFYAKARHRLPGSPLNPAHGGFSLAPVEHPLYAIHGKERRHETPLRELLGRLSYAEAKHAASEITGLERSAHPGDLQYFAKRQTQIQRHAKRVEHIRDILQSRL